ncbi:EAL domain-containing protein (plasmid) [Caballeronia sp. NK8]|uniref:bifunctional diguanylate cyclase/phosphodiesterase n=1 Tax=Caballeronia sp. NK8 TaxID=140098 RepID=UPI001BB5E1F3|nr:EAL domain-containing protein [Caballeronia sp. NK8]BCQ28923.1 EAL domain-containing protein [Caballeronia sp. NK8]
MKRNPFFKLLAHLRVGHKLLLIYLLDLSAVIYISGILIHEKYLAIDFSNKEIVGSAYVHEVEHSITSIAMAGAGKLPTVAQLDAEVDRLVRAEQQYGAQMGSAEPSNALRTALQTMAHERELRIASTDQALTASRDLITRIGNQSNLILDPDLDSYYAMSLSILRYPALLTAVNSIGRHLHDGVHARSREEVRSRYLVLEGQLDGVMQGLRSDYAEAGAANRQFERTLTPSFDRMRTAVEAFRHAARVVVDDNVAPDSAVLMIVDSAQQALVQSVDDLWRDTGEQLDGLLHARVQALFSRMWLHLGTALFLLCAILTLVYCVAQQISSPLRKLARVMDVVRRTGDHTKRADWDSQDEIGQLVRGFNEMLAQLDRERVVQKELAATARASAAQSALVEATPVPMVVTAIPGHEVLHANAPGLFWLNGSSTDPWAQGLDSATRARFFQQLSDREAIDEFEVHWKATSQPSWAMLSARRLDFQGRDAILTAFTPINQIKLMEQRLELWGKVFEASSEAIVILNAEARLLTANPSFFRATGYRMDDVAGKPPAFIDTATQDDENGPLGNLLQRVGRSSTWHGEAQISRREGGDYPAWLMISAVHDKRGTVSHYICTLIDITDRKKSEARIQFLAQHDVLTELPNRALFAAKLGVAIAAAQRTRQRVAVLFIDLDRFKNINDSLGHHIGDGLLRSVSRRLLNAVDTHDTVSRLGGDEFTVLLNGVGHASEVARSIAQRLLPLLREAHEVSGLTLQVASSIGVALYPDDGEDIDTLMQNADAAMYQAKSAGRNQVKFFAADMAEQARHRLTLETGLRTAIELSELRLEWQPCLEARSGALVSVEGLLRWKSAVLGEIGPAVFIPVAEDTRLIVSIGAWVIEEACRQLAAWRDEEGLEIRASVNISAIQLREHELVAALGKSLLAHGVPPHCLELEITETVLMDGAEHYAQAIHAIRGLGVKLSLDDFGTGYSSLSYLNRFPLDRLKIDRAFVRDMLDASADLAIVKAIVDLGHELGLRVVAEGVETGHQAQVLRKIGCDELQGFLFAPAIPAEELVLWNRARQDEALDASPA